MNDLRPTLQMKGHSGCVIKIIENKGTFYIRKFSSETNYNSRLINQMQKQIDFYKNKKNNNLKTSKVIQSGYREGIFWFDMEYINGLNAINHFSKCSTNDIKEIVLKLKNYLKNNIADAELIKPPIKKIKEKILSLKKNINKPGTIENYEMVFDYLNNNIPNLNIYKNVCHGDLTLSNLIFKNNEIYCIDFLDSFIDSPIIDLVKLKQDSSLGRIFHINKSFRKLNLTRSRLLTNYLDKELSKIIDDDIIFSKWYNYLQVLNLVRIIPYTKTKKELIFLNNNITKIIKE